MTRGGAEAPRLAMRAVLHGAPQALGPDQQRTSLSSVGDVVRTHESARLRLGAVALALPLVGHQRHSYFS